MKLQYIKNLKLQIKLALENLQAEKKRHYTYLKEALDRIKLLKQDPTLEEEGIQNGGWYTTDSPSIRKSKTYNNKS